MSRLVESWLDSRPLNRRQALIIAIIASALVIDGLDVQLLSLVAPMILQDWGIARQDFGAAMSAALLGSSFGSLVGGGLGDRFGRKSVFVAATLSFGVATALAGLTHSVFGMTLVRLVGGFGFGAVLPTSVALVSEWLPKLARSRVVGMTATGTPLGGMLGAAFLISLLPMLGWRGCFLACGLVSVIFGLLAWVWLPESPSYLVARGKADKAAALLRRYLGVDCTAESLGSADAAAREIDAEAQAGDDRRVFDRSNLRLNMGSWLAFFGVYFVAYGLAAWLPVLLTGAGLDMPTALRASFLYNLCAVVSGILHGLLVPRFGSKRLLLTGVTLTLVALGLLALGVTTLRATHDVARAEWFVMAGSAGVGAFNGALIGVIYAVLALGFPPSCRAGAIGLAMMLGRMGGIVGSFVGGALLSIHGVPDLPFIVALAVAALCALMGTLIIDRHVPRAG
ncbi:MAG: hypothetical protein RLZZ200_1296 [Pseudomonadota bacterium]|jgi:AAHS family 4-hydroxybenzoate transporter-like MFS transporter